MKKDVSTKKRKRALRPPGQALLEAVGEAVDRRKADADPADESAKERNLAVEQRAAYCEKENALQNGEEKTDHTQQNE